MANRTLKQIKARRDKKSDREFVVVFNSSKNSTFKRVWTFLGTGSRFQAKKRLVKNKARRHQEFKENMKTWYDRFVEENTALPVDEQAVLDWVEKRLKLKLYDESLSMELMRWSEFEKLDKKQWCDGEITLISEEDWTDALEVLPPLKWGMFQGVESFCMRELTSGTFTGQYVKAEIGGKTVCGTTTVCIYDENTWITFESLKKAYEASKG